MSYQLCRRNSLQLQKCVYRMVLVHHDWWDYCWPGWKCTGITVRFFAAMLAVTDEN